MSAGLAPADRYHRVHAGGRATGVAYRQQGTDRVAHAGAEVLLDGGAINSPQLLMLSGVGPAAHLRELGIGVVADLPVGENLQDHPVVPLLWHTRGTTDLADFATPGRLAQWRLLGRGPLASNVAEAGAFFTSRDGLPAPDIQVHMAPTGFLDNGLREPAGRMFATGATLVSVASRGRLRLASADPLWRPEIDAGYFDDPADLDAMLAGCRTLLEIAGQAPIAGWPAARSCPPADATAPTNSCSATSGTGPRRSITRPGPARWAAVTAPSSTRSCGSTGSSASGSSMPR